MTLIVLLAVTPWFGIKMAVLCLVQSSALIVLEQPVASAHEWQKVRAADPPDKWPCPIMTH